MSDNTNLHYIDEGANYGVTPTTGNWKELLKSEDRFTGQPVSQKSSLALASGQPAKQVRLGFDAPGGFNSVLMAGAYDDLFEAAFRGTWSSDSLNVGTVDRSFSVEKQFIDHSRFTVSKGVRVNGFSSVFNHGSEATIDFDMPGAVITSATSTAVVTGITASPNNPAMGTTTDIGQILIDGGNIAFCMDQLSMECSWQMEGINCLGSEAKSDMRATAFYFRGTYRIALSQASFDNWTNKVLGFADTAIVVPISAGGKSYTFTLPSVKLSGPAPSSPSNNGVVYLTGSYEAQYDTTTTTTANIVRVP